MTILIRGQGTWYTFLSNLIGFSDRIVVDLVSGQRKDRTSPKLGGKHARKDAMWPRRLHSLQQSEISLVQVYQCLRETDRIAIAGILPVSICSTQSSAP